MRSLTPKGLGIPLLAGGGIGAAAVSVGAADALVAAAAVDDPLVLHADTTM